MNCKPNDLAMVVRCTDGDACGKALVHRAIVKVVAPVLDRSGWVWTLEAPYRCPVSIFGCRITELPDRDLRPIRGDEGDHPGDVKVRKSGKITFRRSLQSVTIDLPGFPKPNQGDA